MDNQNKKNQNEPSLADAIFIANAGPEMLARVGVALTLIRHLYSSLRAKGVLTDVEIQNILDTTRQAQIEAATGFLEGDNETEQEFGKLTIGEITRNMDNFQSLIFNN